MRNCLYQAERLNIKSIAFPALGTGKLSYPGRDVAQAMFDAVDEFKKEAVNPGIRKIYFIVHESDVKLCDVGICFMVFCCTGFTGRLRRASFCPFVRPSIRLSDNINHRCLLSATPLAVLY